MGQNSEKIQFQHQNQMQSKRKAIFQHGKDKEPVEYCYVPGCQCALPHGQFDSKVCEDCQEQPPPFLRNKNHPSYYEEDFSVKEVESKISEPYPYRELHQAESIPTRISYYNAWSLPTQKYYLRDRPHFHERIEHKHEQQRLISSEDSRTNVDSLIRHATERLVNIVDPPKIEYDRRRQNMNMAD